MAAAAVTGLTVALALPDAMVGVFYDDGIYAALAKSLAEGTGYRLHYLPGAPHAVHYPVLYPAFLAALWSLWPSFPENAALLRGANALLMAVFAGGAVAYAAPRLALPAWATALAVTLAATSIPLLAVATVLFSEPLFLVLAALACWAADAAADERHRRRHALLAGALAGLAALTRTIGVAVIAGVTIALLRRAGRGPAAVAFALAALLVTPWVLWSAAWSSAVDPVMAANYGTYLDLLRQSGFGWLGPASLLEFARPLRHLALPPLPAALVVLTAAPALAAVGVGFLALVRKTPAAGWMMVVYLAIVAVWPYGPDRFVWAALPWLACAFAAGVHALWTGTGARVRVRRAGAAAATLVVAAGFLPRQVVGLARGDATATQRGISATFADILPWVREATDTSAVLAGEDEALLWLYTGRRAVPSYLWHVRGRGAVRYGPDTLRAFLTRNGVTHLLMTGNAADAAPDVDALMGRHPGFLRIVRMWPGPLVAFAVDRSAPAP